MRQRITEPRLRAKLVEPAKLLALFAHIEPDLYRYPAIHPPAFRAAVESFVKLQ